MEDVSVLSIFSCSEYNFYISRISGWREGSQNASMYPSIVGYFTITIVCNWCGLLWMIVISAMIVLYSTMREPNLYSDSGYIRDMWCGTFFSFAPNNLNPEFLFLNLLLWHSSFHWGFFKHVMSRSFPISHIHFRIHWSVRMLQPSMIHFHTHLHWITCAVLLITARLLLALAVTLASEDK